MSFELPPLRRREEDIPLLIDHFLKPDWRIEPEARAALERFSWPGNVRQLINVLERGKILADDRTIRVSDLPAELVAGPAGHSPCAGQNGVPPDNLAMVERAHVVEVLRRERGNKARAARALGVNRRSLYRLVEKFAIGQQEIDAAM